MEATRSENAAPDAAHNPDAIRRTGTGVTTLRENEVEEITPIAKHSDLQTRPKSLDEPFKIRYNLLQFIWNLIDVDM
jgi:hypothetical protein